jgi:hypothetical protein
VSLRSVSTTREEVPAPSSEQYTRAPPRAESFRRNTMSRSKTSSTQRSTDEPRPKSSKSRDESHGGSSHRSRGPPEDAARKARHQERRRAKEEEKKPTGIKAAFKRLFAS